jgi:hypothetical protein
MRATVQPILELLDEGLRIYRREFVRFALIAALGAVPGIIALLLILQLSESSGVWAALGAAVLGLPLGIYVLAATSRATLLARAGAPIALRRALAIGPLRLLGMGCYGGIFLIMVNIAISVLSMFCFCPLYLVIGASFIGAAGAGPSGAAGGAFVGLLSGALVVIFVLFYGFSLVLSGATYGSLVFSLQPFVQGQLRLGAAIQRSVDLVFYRFGANLLIYLCASLAFGALALSVTAAVGVLVPLPLVFFLGQESPIARGVSAAAWLAGLTAAAPLLPIWMALLYERRMAERAGGDLGERIAAFARSGDSGYADGQRG